MSAKRLLGLAMVSLWLVAGCSSAKKIEVGGTCVLNSDCNSPLLCTDSKCHDACHASIDCPPGQNCMKTAGATVCQLPAEASCARTLCSSAYVCASDLQCRTPCQSVTDCASEQVCVTNVCADPNELVPSTGQLPQKGPSLAADGGTDARATATGGTGGGGGLGGTGGTSGGAVDAAAAGHGSANDAAGAVGGAGGSSGGTTAGTGGAATPDASSLDVRQADAPPDAKAPTPDTAVVISGDGGASTVLTGCGKVTTKRYFCDDFESGLDNWHHATEGWDLVTTTFQSASHSVADSPNGNYPAGAKSEITMVSSVDLTGAVSPVVTLWHKLALASYCFAVDRGVCYVGPAAGSCAAGSSDHAYIEISTDSGMTWSQLADMFDTSNTSTWLQQQLSLSTYVGKKIKLRFRLAALLTVANCQGDGWYIDDVEIREAELPGVPDAGLENPIPAEPTGCDGAAVAGRYFCEDFETATSLTTSWQVATEGWNTVASTSQSPTHSVTDSPNGNYPAGATSDMRMAASVDLTGAVWPVVTFWHKLNLGSEHGCDLHYGTDNTYVDASSDGGTTWTVLTNFNCADNTSVWSFRQLSLASCAGKRTRLRFRLSGPNGGADGWYIDDIKIRENEFVPAPSDLALCTTQAAGGACNSADLCGKTCGPDLLGSKSLTCAASKFVEGACTFPAGADYSCYKVGAVAACPTGIKAGQACTATACQACGATTGTGYLDASGAAKQGFCVCSKGIWSCGTTGEWPCYPQTAGATVPASCD